MKTDRRWLQWILTESARPPVALPWHRAMRQQSVRHLTKGSGDQDAAT